MREVGAPLRSCCQYSGGKELISQHIHGPSTAVNGRSNCCLFPLEGTSFCPAPTAGTAHWEQMTARRRAAAGRCLQERRVPEQRGCGGGVGLWGDRASPSFAIPRAGKTRAMSGRRGGAERSGHARSAPPPSGPAPPAAPGCASRGGRQAALRPGPARVCVCGGSPRAASSPRGPAELGGGRERCLPACRRAPGAAAAPFPDRGRPAAAGGGGSGGAAAARWLLARPGLSAEPRLRHVRQDRESR